MKITEKQIGDILDAAEVTEIKDEPGSNYHCMGKGDAVGVPLDRLHMVGGGIDSFYAAPLDMKVLLEGIQKLVDDAIALSKAQTA